ncbi:glycosyltransferase family 2 protein [Methylomonas sp. LW13]|uniref:glycosyltransferase family 2 protein n=1 Tax=unclassified Methylomonas TaxID=2608980 RepID=UPI00051C42C9|nr:glycosyltransferase family 2 protein [Methylomonas sp. LW13]QBC28213.1 glycosyltransferase family 2 protein [Methylomonas sp. LW13]
MNKENRPLLTIAIPTWNRANYLVKNIEQIVSQLGELTYPIEILVSDNCSSDNTKDCVDEFLNKGLPIRYIRNSENIGPDLNIAQCFNQAAGQYVLIFGDDDLLIDGSLKHLESLLARKNYGVVSVRAYGYDFDFRAEYPGGSEKLYEFANSNEFIVKLGKFSTLISVNIISKDYLQGVDANDYCGTNLVHIDLIYSAALKAPVNLYVDSYLVAYKRNNSGGYSFSDVFVDKFGAIVDKYIDSGLSVDTKYKLESDMLIGYYPYYVLRLRLQGTEDLSIAYSRFNARFSRHWTFHCFVAPIFKLPKGLAIIYGAISVFIGRVLTGDFRRGCAFVWVRLGKFIRH